MSRRDIITGPCLAGDMDEDWYHSDPISRALPGAEGGSLSVSGAKKLLPPSCPAIFNWERKHPSPPTPQMEEGTIIHAILLGTPQPAEVHDFRDWTTAKAKEARKAARAAGKIPVLLHRYAELEAIARAVMDDPECGGLLAEGDREVSGFWQDEEFGIWLRMRMDSATLFGQVPTIVDVKSCADSSPEKFAKQVADFRYDMQSEWYREGWAALLRCNRDDVDFVLVAVPTSEPYLPMAYRIEDPRDSDAARESNRIAREIYRDCTERDVWPKWSRDITPLALPGYARSRIDRDIQEWHA